MSKKIVKINGYDVSNAVGYVWDRCHEFYIIEDEADRQGAIEGWNHAIEPLTDDMFQKFITSCPFRFIMNWKLTNYLIPQISDTMETKEFEFEFEDGTIGIYDVDAEYGN